jgi:hypothetical protein
MTASCRSGMPAPLQFWIVREEAKLKIIRKLYTITFVACASMAAPAAHAEANKVVIGDIDDMSGVYADIIGPSGVEAAPVSNGFSTPKWSSRTLIVSPRPGSWPPPSSMK